ncbi:MAG: hypothetical protein JST16_12510 [Bdellovibrionales bacterium]|nr:hypothetical protein [Bdellovibrionales bacterium]
MKQQNYRHFTANESAVWRTLFTRQAKLRDQQIVSIFSEGIKKLGLCAEQIPDLDEVNERLYRITGFEGVPVEGLEDSDAFYPALSEGKFPIGNFIRGIQDIDYTPAPDIFHDLYGHLPFLTYPPYAAFTREFGKRATRFLGQPARLREFERLYWFGIEFSLIKTKGGRQIFGAGIASSFTECAFALSDAPEVRPFDLDDIRHREFRVDQLQSIIYLLQNENQLFDCLDKF